MKKVIKAICCILAAVILVGGGYVAGEKYHCRGVWQKRNMMTI